MSQQHIILIGGPTASGKSALAMKLAGEQKGTIINADAMQVYAGLPLLTAQPDPQDQVEIPHLLYETTDPASSSSAGKWVIQAREAISQTFKEGRTPILVGGTGLYFESLRGGLANIPEIPEAVRNTSEALYAELGEEDFRKSLAAHDRESALRIERNDRQRLVRAYAVALYTGKALSLWQEEGRAVDGLEGMEVETHLLLPEREMLYGRCDKRFSEMIERGAVDEVKHLLARELSPSLPAMKILGVREIASYLSGDVSLKDAIVKAQQMTRNYAKRQMTWFRNRWN